MEVHWNYIFFEKYMYILFFYLRRWIFWNPTLLLKRIKFNSYLLNLVSKNGTGINMPHSVTFNTYCFKLAYCAYCAFKDTRVLYIDWNFPVLKQITCWMIENFSLFWGKVTWICNIQPFLLVERKPMNHTLIFSDFKFSKYVCTSTVVLSD